MKTHVTAEKYRATQNHPALCGERQAVSVLGPNKFKRLKKEWACKKCQKALKARRVTKDDSQ